MDHTCLCLCALLDHTHLTVYFRHCYSEIFQTLHDHNLSWGLHFHCRLSHRLTFCWGCNCLRFRHKPTELAHSFYSVLVFVSVFMALSTAFHSIIFCDNSPLLTLFFWFYFCLIGPFNYISMKVSLSPDIILCG